MFLPMGEDFLSLLPFIGDDAQGNISYRESLYQNSLIVIGDNLLFGSEDFLQRPEMQALVQGQGIVDIVNSYLQILLNYGVIGLALFLLFFGKLLLQSFRSVRTQPQAETYGKIGRSLIASLVGTLVFIATTSSISVIPIVYLALAGLCMAYCRSILEPAQADINEDPLTGWQSMVQNSNLPNQRTASRNLPGKNPDNGIARYR